MPEVDRSVSPPTPPTGQPTGGAAEKSSKPAQPGRDARIDELVAQRERYRMQFEQEKASREELAREVASIKEQLQTRETRPDDQPITSWQQFPNKDLDAIISEGPGENPQAYMNAHNEKLRRVREDAIKDASRNARALYDAQRNQEEILSRIKQTFPDALNRESPLYRKADEEYGKLVQKYGKDVVHGIPDIQELILHKAKGELSLPDMEELQELRRQVAERKQHEALESGFRPAREDQALQDAIKRKDRKAIFANLPIVKSLGERRG